jgi:bifunctional pyridoxal-dependent enzyme with beta-cystathionase and maltose regulon repressor activities
LKTSKLQLLSNIETMAKRAEADMPGVSFQRPEATYLAWLDFSHSAIADDPSKHILKRAGLRSIRGRSSAIKQARTPD